MPQPFFAAVQANANNCTSAQKQLLAGLEGGQQLQGLYGLLAAAKAHT
jgi:hypothetical protein